MGSILADTTTTSATPAATRTDISVSFEFFPPATPKAERTLSQAVTRVAALRPRFVSVTYGAGGSDREDRTGKAVKHILDHTDLAVAGHLNCVGATREQVDEVIRRYYAMGVRHIVALRGDPPDHTQRFTPHPGGYRNAQELVQGIRRIADFEVSVAAHPEVHPDAPSPQADLDNLRRKLDAGAARAITQFFFDVDVYFRFLDRAHATGITAPIIPGILPIANFTRVRQFAAVCGASLPRWLVQLFDGLDDDPGTRQMAAATVLAEQCRRLREQGVRDFHFYTLNRGDLTWYACHFLGIRPAQPDIARVAHG